MARRDHEAAFAEHLASFLGDWGPVRWRSLLQGTAVAPRPDIAAMFHALSRVEDDAFYMQVRLRRIGIFHISTVSQFNAIWLAEESEHSRALAALAVRYGGADAPIIRKRVWSRDKQSLWMVPLLKCRGLYPRGILAGYLTLGAVQELVALTVYNAAAQLLDDPPARAVLRAISRQEGRHMRFYRRCAEIMLTESVATQRYVRFILRRYWRPPGIDLLGRAGWERSLAPLLDDPSVRDRFACVDTMCDNLPGLRGMRLMETFLRRYGTAGRQPKLLSTAAARSV